MAGRIKIKEIRSLAASAMARPVAGYDPGFALPQFAAIEARLAETEAMGSQPLWDGYAEVKNYGRKVSAGARRSADQVRSKPALCRFYSWLVTQKRPEAVLEFGAAFGASGMYWLAGIEAAGIGHLYSFEPNPVWFPIARANMDRISARATLANGTFEAGVASVPPVVDIALIDAIHTRDFVTAQFALVRRVARPGALVIFDDIDFSDDMRACWQEIAADPALAAVWELNGRVGMVELPA